MTEDELYHYGVKGMKWGVRRFSAKRNADTMSREKLQKNVSDFKGRNEELGRVVNKKERAAVKIAGQSAKNAKKTSKAFKKASKNFDANSMTKVSKTFKKNKKLSSKNAKIQRQIAKAKKEMSKNQKIVDLLNTKFSTLKADSGSTSTKTNPTLTKSTTKKRTNSSADLSQKVEKGKDFIKKAAPVVTTAAVSSALMVSGMGHLVPVANAASSIATEAVKTAINNDDKKR